MYVLGYCSRGVSATRQYNASGTCRRALLNALATTFSHLPLVSGAARRPLLGALVSRAWTSRKQHNALGAAVFAIIIASLVIGILLARFNIFAALIGAAICAASAFAYDISRDVAPSQAFLASLGAAFALQLGYLATQFLRRQQK